MCQSFRILNADHLLHRTVQRFRGGLVFKAHRLVYHSRVIKKRVLTPHWAQALTYLSVRSHGEAGPLNHHDDNVDSDL